MNTCPVCLFGNLPYPARDYHICPCCGTEFGNDDARFTHEQLREAWIAGGARWFFGRPPERWNPWIQLVNHGGLPTYLIQVMLSFEMSKEPVSNSRMVSLSLADSQKIEWSLVSEPCPA